MRPGLQKSHPWVRWALVAAALGVLTLLLILPLALVLIEALRPGWRAFAGALADADALASLRLTLVAALVAVPLNTVFGLAAAWLIARRRFWGRDLMLGFIDLPFAISRAPIHKRLVDHLGIAPARVLNVSGLTRPHYDLLPKLRAHSI